jgi:hypothetical protein
VLVAVCVGARVHEAEAGEDVGAGVGDVERVAGTLGPDIGNGAADRCRRCGRGLQEVLLDVVVAEAQRPLRADDLDWGGHRLAVHRAGQAHDAVGVEHVVDTQPAAVGQLRPCRAPRGQQLEARLVDVGRFGQQPPRLQPAAGGHHRGGRQREVADEGEALGQRRRQAVADAVVGPGDVDVDPQRRQLRAVGDPAATRPELGPARRHPDPHAARLGAVQGARCDHVAVGDGGPVDVTRAGGAVDREQRQPPGLVDVAVQLVDEREGGFVRGRPARRGAHNMPQSVVNASAVIPQGASAPTVSPPRSRRSDRR